MTRYVNLMPGDPVPWFALPSGENPRYVLDTTAGRYIVLCFFVTAADPTSREALSAVHDARSLFDDARACFFGISNDQTDQTNGRIANSLPGLRFFWDFGNDVAKKYGAAPDDSNGKVDSDAWRRFWLVLDPTMRILKVVPFAANDSGAGEVIDYLKSLPPPEQFCGFDVQAPVLVLPQVFEPEFCEQLIALYDKDGGEESGFMREVEGKTVMLQDHKHKRRRDYGIEDKTVIQAIQSRIIRRVVPEIMKVHQFQVTRMERYVVACYAAEDGAHFKPHRDNTTSGTAHRRFAVSINLNSAFEGGEVGFPEYGPRTYKAPAGGAVVFSCSLLHRVTPVTEGRRYAFLPFLYDDAAARLREENVKHLGEGVAKYKMGS
ncbi:MAG: 2OG-Fe(II) oxygenase [Pseudomonadota bacterium]